MSDTAEDVARAEMIVEVVAVAYHLKDADVLKSRRSVHSIARPRHVAIYLCRELTALSFPELGRFFGGLHHTTAIYAVETVRERMQAEPGLRRLVEALTAELGAEPTPPRNLLDSTRSTEPVEFGDGLSYVPNPQNNTSPLSRLHFDEGDAVLYAVLEDGERIMIACGHRTRGDGRILTRAGLRVVAYNFNRKDRI